MTTDEIREAYLAFFESKGCTRKPSDLLVPHGDPTVLFTPAGMNQFKREFMGLGDPSFKRAATCQKCLRTGDIENVGRTPRHQTFFEMLGNFSFGDYFKREAIHWAWEFLLKHLRIDPSRLSVSVYLDDDEAYGIWRDEIKLDPGRIRRLGEDDNFWPASAPSQGPNGVCGPCSEIFFHAEGVEEVEIWNLVFTQFNRVGPNQLEPLPSKNIDTGSGLERVAAAIQGVTSNFEIDLFKPLVAEAAAVLGIDYVKAKETINGVRIRRAADHSRALVFCIHENVRPGPEKQGYVIRRLLRRAVLDAYQMGRREPFLFQLVPVVARVMKGPYPELADSVPRIQTVIREEEERFLRNLENGLSLLEDVFRKTKAAGANAVAGADLFELHATYGIPIEVTESLAAERNLAVDRAGFEAALKVHGEVSRGQAEAFDVFATGPLDSLKEVYAEGSAFLGYETTEARGKVIGIVAQGKLVDRETVSPANAPAVVVVLDRTPFYGESGGQVGDTGELRGESFRFQVEDTKRENDFVLHVGRVVEGCLDNGATVHAVVDAARRQAIKRAHTATHVLHHALQKHLGKHAQQAGSKVEPDRLRFDFSNPGLVGRDLLRQIEDTVNEHILTGEAVSWKRMPLAEAKAKGAMALFGEKYPEVVRVVELGAFSRELCGGTHLDHVGQIGGFRLVGEESVAAGTRRITAVTGLAAFLLARQQEDALARLGAALKVPVGQVVERVESLLEELKSQRKELATRKAQSGTDAADGRISAEDLLKRATQAGETRVVVAELGSAAPDELRQMIDVLRRKSGERLAVLLASVQGEKVQLVAGLTPDLVARGMHAGNLLKVVAPIVGGGGGGRPDLAQAGGKDPSKVAEALEAAARLMQEQAARP